MSSIVGPVELFFLLVLMTLVVTPIWGAVDAGMKDAWMWRAKAHNKRLWLTMLIAGFFLQPLGFVALLLYVVWIRPRLRAAQRDSAQLQSPAASPGPPRL